MSAAARGAPRTDDAAGVVLLREALWAAGFTVRGIAEILGVETASLSPRRSEIPGLLRRLGGDGPLATLVRLFLAGAPVDRAAAEQALRPLTLDRAIAVGVVTDGGNGQVSPALHLAPAGDLLLANDVVLDLVHDITADTVVGVSASSRALADLTIRRPIQNALDLGTGSGVQALLAAKHAAHVTATDSNPRALDFVRFNAMLNGLSNVDVVEGNLLDAVTGQTFDLIVSNPPFVISPDADYLYRDGGRPRDALSRDLVRAVPSFLSDHGFAHLLIGWVHEPDGDWSAPLREWVDGLGCDAWLLHFLTLDRVAHATSWNHTLVGDHERYAATVERWLDYFEAEDIDAIGYGAVILRKRAGDNWVRAQSTATASIEPANDQVREFFTARDFLDGLEPGALLDQHLVVDARSRLDQSMRFVDGGFNVEGATLHLERGLPFTAVVDHYSARLLSELDGTRPVHEAVDRTMAALSAEADRSAVDARTAAIVTQMVELGFVHPVTRS